MSATTDSGTATTVNVFIALPANARCQQSIHNIALGYKSAKQANKFDVGIYFGSRVDTGTHITNTWVSGASKFGYYFSDGGINIDFDKGWRADSAGLAGLYWRVRRERFLRCREWNHRQWPLAYDTANSGAAVMLDNAACVPNSSIHFTQEMSRLRSTPQWHRSGRFHTV